MLLGAAAYGAVGAKETPDFREVYDLVRAQLAGTSDTDLNRAAVEGLVAALAPKVALISAARATNVSAPAVLSKTALFDDTIAYVRVDEVAEGLAPALRKACQVLSPSNQLKGVVLDLRYARGADYAAAVAAADLFLKQERPMLDWGHGVVRSTAKTNAFAWPSAVLVNAQTAGAAEALAAILREVGAGLILGGQTAGQALRTQDFPLKTGDRLRIAVGSVQLGDGSSLAGGVKPDITVEVSPADERMYFADAYKVLGPNAGTSFGQTNLARRPRMNEAELVRERREGPQVDEGPAAGRKGEAEKVLVQDPALARALDLLKGLAVVRSTRS